MEQGHHHPFLSHCRLAKTVALQALMEAGLLGASMAQPIDNCLTTLGRLMVSGPLGSPVMSSSWQPLDILGKGSSGNEKKVTPPARACLCLHLLVWCMAYKQVMQVSLMMLMAQICHATVALLGSDATMQGITSFRIGPETSVMSMQDLLGSILTVMGLTAGNVSNTDTLARLGIDSMQMVEVSNQGTVHAALACVSAPVNMLTADASSVSAMHMQNYCRQDTCTFVIECLLTQSALVCNSTSCHLQHFASFECMLAAAN